MSTSESATITFTPHGRLAVSRRAVLEVTLLAGICLLPIALLAPFFNAPLMNDEGIFATIAREVLNGGLPYHDLFDITPPAIYGWYAFGFLLFGEEVWVPHVLLAVVLSLTTLLVYYEGRLLFSPRAGFAAAFAFALSTGTVQLGSWAQPGYFVLLPLMASLLTFTLGLKRQHIGWYLAAGVFSSLAIITMQLTAIHYLVLLGFSISLSRQASGSRPHRYAPTAALVSGAVSVFVLLAVPYALAGAFDDLFYGAVQFPLLYADNLAWAERLRIGLNSFRRFLVVASPWAILAATGAGALFTYRDRRRSLVLAWAAVTVLALAATGYFNTHYFALLRPAMALLAGYVAEAYWPFRNWLRVKPQLRAAFYLTMLLAIYLSAFLNGQIYGRPSYVERHIAKGTQTTRVREVQSYSMSAYIAQHTSPNDTIYNLGRQGEIYFHANRRPASRYFHEFPLKSDPRTVPQLLDDLGRNRPVYIIDTQWPEYLEGLTDMYPWQILPFLKEHYEYEGKVYFDPALAEVYRSGLGEEKYQRRKLTYYADIYRLKDSQQ